MDDKTKRALADKNGKTNELYVETVRKLVTEDYKTADENAILRKAIAYLFALLSSLLEGKIDNTEFAEYNEKIEKIKSKVKTDLGIE